MTRLIVLAAALLVLPAVGVHAGDAPPRPPQLGLCAACHGAHGTAVVPGVPNLAGQRLDYLLDALKQYRDGRRDVAQMRAAVGPLTDAQLRQLAQWYAAQTPAVPHAR
jgi:cytochrome c553